MRYLGTDRHHLKDQQYRTAANLEARIRLHNSFSTNPDRWCRWLFDRLDLPAGARILDVGCGPGWLWAENLDRLPGGWRVTLGDLSSGMIAAARRNVVAGPPGRLRLAVLDAGDLPFGSGTFDAVVANHMLYHVPNRARAVAEFRRVLVRGGRLYAATNGQEHLTELGKLAGGDGIHGAAARFGLENGAQQLQPHFDPIHMIPYEDALKITEVEPLIAYLRSMRSSGSPAPYESDVAAHVQAEIDLRGHFHIQKQVGLFVATSS